MNDRAKSLVRLARGLRLVDVNNTSAYDSAIEKAIATLGLTNESPTAVSPHDRAAMLQRLHEHAQTLIIRERVSVRLDFQELAGLGRIFVVTTVDGVEFLNLHVSGPVEDVRRCYEGELTPDDLMRLWKFRMVTER